MPARSPRLALLVVIASWAVLGALRDAQRDRYAAAERYVWIDEYFRSHQEARDGWWAEIVRLAGDHPEVQAGIVLRDSVAAQEAQSAALATHRAAQDSAAATYGVTRDTSGAYVGPEAPGLLLAIPGPWFHGAFGVVAGLLALLTVAAPPAAAARDADPSGRR